MRRRHNNSTNACQSPAAFSLLFSRLETAFKHIIASYEDKRIEIKRNTCTARQRHAKAASDINAAMMAQ
jgi:hypothetical protein